jgi:hypothetical protein
MFYWLAKKWVKDENKWIVKECWKNRNGSEKKKGSQ